MTDVLRQRHVLQGTAQRFQPLVGPLGYDEVTKIANYAAAEMLDEIAALAASLQAAEEEAGLFHRQYEAMKAAYERLEARLQAAEEALRLAEGLTLMHDIEHDTDPDSFADYTGFDAIDCKACLFNVARGKPDRRDPAKVAALGSVG